MNIKVGKTYLTRDGREVRVVAIDYFSGWAPHRDHCVLGICERFDDNIGCWRIDGKRTINGDDSADLVKEIG